VDIMFRSGVVLRLLGFRDVNEIGNGTLNILSPGLSSIIYPSMRSFFSPVYRIFGLALISILDQETFCAL
jgi:hypothetical protein